MSSSRDTVYYITLLKRDGNTQWEWNVQGEWWAWGDIPMEFNIDSGTQDVLQEAVDGAANATVAHFGKKGTEGNGANCQHRFAYSREEGEDGGLTHRRCEHCGTCEQWVTRRGWVGIKPPSHCKHGHIVQCPSCGVVAA